MRRDIPPVRPIWIYRGLIFGYAAELAGFAVEKKLDKMCGTDEFSADFLGE
jgi:hypothetical protein